MIRNIGTLAILLIALTACTSSQRESAAWAVLTPVAIVVGPIVAISNIFSDVSSREQRAEEWQAITDPIYLAKIEQIKEWSPIEDAKRFWRQGDVVYWRANNSRMRFTGLNPKSASELVEIDREKILANYEIYAGNPELSIRAEVLANELVGITYPRDYRALNGSTYACYERTAAEYEYLFNTQMASLTQEYDVLPDYREQITMKIEDPCSQLDSRKGDYRTDPPFDESVPAA